MARISARVLKSGIPSYTAEIRLQGYPHTSKTFRTKTEAKKWAKLKEVQMLEGKYNGTPLSTQKRLKDAIKRFLESPRTNKSWLKQKRNKPMLKFWQKELGHHRLADLRAAMIVEKRDKLSLGLTYRKKLRSPATCNRYISGLSVILQLCVEEWGWLEQNPARRIRRFPESEGSTRILTDEERFKLLKACHSTPDLYDIVLLALNTGARRSELEGLRWGEVDLKEEMVTFRKTKNGKDRTIPLSQEASEVLKARLRARIIGRGEWVFPSPNLNAPRDFYKTFMRALDKAGVTEFRFHDLRHTAGSYLAIEGVSERYIAEILGHKTLEMVKRYTHLRPEHLRDAVAVLGRQKQTNLGKSPRTI